MVKDPSLWGEKYVRNASTAAPSYEAGVRNPKRSPTQAAISKATEWQAKVASPTALEKFKAGLKHAGDEAWLNGALNKGVARYADGVQQGANKYNEFAGKFARHLASAENKIAAMPKTNIEQSIAKSAAQIRHNSAYSNTK